MAEDSPQPRFVVDSMLGTLAKWLRAFGFDVTFYSFINDHELIAQAREKGAIVLTRDTRFPKPPDVRVMLIQSDHLDAQLRQVAIEVPLDLAQAQSLSRCTVCNQELEFATRDQVQDRIPPYVYLTQRKFALCPGCGRVYWEGTHVGRMRERLESLIRQSGRGIE